MKIRLFIAVIMIFGTVYCGTVAEIGDYLITKNDVYEKIENEPDKNLNFENALKLLLEEKALLLYAKEQGIRVSNYEVENFFITQLGSSPMFTTNGEFDYSKYNKQKNNPKIKNVLKLMKTELLVNKSKMVLESQFDINDKDLLNAYIEGNAKISIGYGLIKKEEADVPITCTPAKAMNFYKEHRHRFLSGYQRKVAFFVVLNDNNNEKSNLEKAKSYAKKWKKQNNLDIPIFYSLYLTPKSNFGMLAQSNRVMEIIFEMDKNEICSPIDIGFGFLVCKLVDIREPEVGINSDNGRVIWKEFFNYEKNFTYKGEYKNYYSTNIDSFETSVAIVTRLIIPKNISNKKEIRESILSNISNEKKLKKISSRNNIEYSRERIFLSKFSNKDEYNTLISSSIATFPNTAFKIIKKDDYDILYDIHTVFPNYLPAYDDIKQDVHKIIKNSLVVSNMSEIEEENFYTLNKHLFRLKNKVGFSGVFVPINVDSVSVKSSKIRNYYNDNKNSFKRVEQYKFEYIFLRDENKENSNIIHNIFYWLNKDNWNDIKKLYGTNDKFLQNEWINSVDILPEFLNNLRSSKIISEPFFYENGWYILKKIDYHSSGLLSYEKIKDEIEEKLKIDLAKDRASDLVKTIYDSLRYFSQCKIFADSTMIFSLKKQEFSKPFPLLGDLSELEPEIMRMYKNEKFSKIVPTENGYAILFVSEIEREKQLSYEEAKDLISNIYRVEKKDEFISDFVDNLGSQIRKGSNPRDIFVFFGGWKEFNDVTVKTILPGIPFSKIIIEDALTKKIGDVSHPILIDEDTYLIYKLKSKQKLKMSDFDYYKDSLKESLTEKYYKDELNNIKMRYKFKRY